MHEASGAVSMAEPRLCSPLSLPLLLAGLLKVLRSPPHPAMELRMEDMELGLNCCVLLRMKEADSDDDWLPGPLPLPAQQQHRSRAMHDAGVRGACVFEQCAAGQQHVCTVWAVALYKRAWMGMGKPHSPLSLLS